MDFLAMLLGHSTLRATTYSTSKNSSYWEYCVELITLAARNTIEKRTRTDAFHAVEVEKHRMESSRIENYFPHACDLSLQQRELLAREKN